MLTLSYSAAGWRRMAGGVGEGSENTPPRPRGPAHPRAPWTAPPRPSSLVRWWLPTSVTLCVGSFSFLFFFFLEFSTSDIKHPHENISLYCFEH